MPVRYPSLPEILQELRELRESTDDAPDEGKLGKVGDAVGIYTVHRIEGVGTPMSGCWMRTREEETGTQRRVARLATHRTAAVAFSLYA